MDPTRIPVIMAALEQVWRGQADLPLAAIWQELELRGVSASTMDEELLETLSELHKQAPSEVQVGSTPRLVLIETESPRRWLTLDAQAGTVVVRDPEGRIAPGFWELEPATRVRLGEPCILRDREGTAHRFGVAMSLQVMGEPRENLTGLVPREGLYGVQLAEGEGLVILGSPATLYARGRRSTDVDTVRWQRVLRGAVGEDLVLLDPQGVEKQLGAVAAIFAIAI